MCWCLGYGEPPLEPGVSERGGHDGRGVHLLVPLVAAHVLLLEGVLGAAGVLSTVAGQGSYSFGMYSVLYMVLPSNGAPLPTPFSEGLMLWRTGAE